MNKRSPSGHRCGEWHPKAALTAEQVLAMREDYATGRFSIRSVAAKYKCGASTARDIISYATRVAG